MSLSTNTPYKHQYTPTSTPSAAVSNTPQTDVDPELIWSVFHQTVPVKLVFASSKRIEHPVYMNAPRNSYLPLLIHAAHLLFSLEDRLVKFSSAQTDLCWYYPLGVLFDSAPTTSGPCWEISVRLASETDAYSVSLTDLDHIWAMYQNELKQAEYLCFGSVKNSRTLTKQACDDLWQAIIHNNLTTTEPILLSLFQTSPVSRAWPIRIHFRSARRPYIQPFEPVDDRSLTLVQFITKHAKDTSQVSVVIHGLDMHWDTPLTWIHKHLLSVDGWIYMIVVPTLPSCSPDLVIV